MKRPISRIRFLLLTFATPWLLQRQQQAVDVDRIPRLTATSELRLGDPDVPNEAIGAVGSVDVDRYNQIYVYEAKADEIRVYDGGGRRVRTIGRSGTGPGELAHVQNIGVLGDTVWAISVVERRVNLFRRTGELIRSSTLLSGTVSVAADRRFLELEPRFMRPDGKFVSGVTNVYRSDDALGRAMIGAGMRLQPPSDSVRIPRLLFDPSKSEVDTIGWHPLPRDPSVDGPTPPFQSVQAGSTRLRVPRPTSDAAIIASLPTGTVVVSRQRPNTGRRSIFEVVRYDLAGRLLVRHQLSYLPEPYDGAVLDTIAARRTDSSVGSAAFKAMRAALKYPGFMVPVRSVWVSASGSVFIRRESYRSQATWIVLNPRGTIEGALVLPDEAQPLWSDKGTVITSEVFSDGVWIVRYSFRNQ